MVLELVKTIACQHGALQELADMGDNKTSRRAQVLLEDIGACQADQVTELLALHKGLDSRWLAAWGDERGSCRACHCTHVGIVAGICSECHFLAGVAIGIPVERLELQLVGAQLTVVDGRTAIVRDGQTQLGPPFTR